MVASLFTASDFISLVTDIGLRGRIRLRARPVRANRSAVRSLALPEVWNKSRRLKVLMAIGTMFLPIERVGKPGNGRNT
jgi:hypothetical protein